MKQRIKQSLANFWPVYLGRTPSLSRRLLGLLGGILLIMLFVIGISVFYFIYKNEQRSWQGRQGEAARYTGEIVATFIERTKNTLIMVSLLNRYYLTAEPQMMDDLLQQDPTLLEMIRLDANGKVFAGAYRDAPLLANLFTIPQSRWFLESQAGRLYLGNVQISATSEPYLIIAIPGPDGGVVAARLHMNLLWDVVAGLRFGETGQAYIINREGLIIAHTDPAVSLTKVSLKGRPETLALLQATDQGWSGSYVNFEGYKVVSVTDPVPGTDWVVVTELPQREAFSTSRTALLILGGGIVLFGLLVMLVTSRLLQQAILQPMEKLRAGAEQIGYGDLEHRINIVRQDEVGQVATAFNQMAVHLDHRNKQLAAQTVALTDEVNERKRIEEALRKLNEELEDRVTKRTLELTRVNKELVHEIGERKRTESALDQAHMRLQHILDTSPTIIYSCQVDSHDSGGDYPPTFISHNVTKTFGYEIEECLGNSKWWSKGLHPEDAPRIKAGFTNLFTQGHLIHEYRFRHKNGNYRWIRDQITLVRDDTGQPVEFVGSLIDITKRMQAEEKIKTSLHEKEILLKEIHHRVKNNLQVISSLLNLQSGYIENQQTLEIFKDSQHRVRSMALIHEKLYQSDNLARIDFGDYIQNLATYLFHSYRSGNGGITLNIQTDDVFLGIDEAVPCGLILNELISNSLKHAFPNGNTGEIKIELTVHDDRQLTLGVGDNGVGLPPEFDIEDTDSLGLQLVDTLVDQLDGAIELNGRQGAEFSIKFVAVERS